jgi:hypothetical protein
MGFLWVFTTPWRHVGDWRCSSTNVDLCTTWRSIGSFTHHSRLLGNSPQTGTLWVRGWLGFRSTEKCLPCRESNSGRPALNPSLYRLSCSGWPLSHRVSRSCIGCTEIWKSWQNLFDWIIGISCVVNGICFFERSRSIGAVNSPWRCSRSFRKKILVPHDKEISFGSYTGSYSVLISVLNLARIVCLLVSLNVVNEGQSYPCNRP